MDYRHPRGLDRAVLRSLFTCQCGQSRQDVLVTGPTGVGKTYRACALAHAACRQGYTARYGRLPRLRSELHLARADGAYPKLLTRLARLDVLVLDDWGLAPLHANDSRELLEVIDDRSQTRATVGAGLLSRAWPCGDDALGTALRAAPIPTGPATASVRPSGAWGPCPRRARG